MRFDKETISSITVTCSFSQSFHLIGLVQGKIKNERKRKSEKKQYRVKSNTKDDCKTIWGQARPCYCILQHQKHCTALQEERRDKNIGQSVVSATQFEPCHVLFRPTVTPENIWTLMPHLKCLNIIVPDRKMSKCHQQKFSLSEITLLFVPFYNCFNNSLFQCYFQ